MTVSEILNRVRVFTDDNVSPYLWSNSDIVEYLNIVIDEVCKETHCIQEAYTEAVCKVTMTDDEPDYALHAKIINIIRARVEDAVDDLERQDLDYLQANYPTWRTNDSADPFLYVLDKRMGYITVYPAPDTDATKTLWLTVSRYPLTALSISEPAQQSELDASPEIPTRYHDKLINGILYHCYEKRDEDTYNPQLSASYMAKMLDDIEGIKRDEILYRETSRVIAPSDYHI